jgi:hypothetical protein
LQSFLTVMQDGSEWSASGSSLLYPLKKPPGTHRDGEFATPRAILDSVKRKNITSNSTQNRQYSRKHSFVGNMAQIGNNKSSRTSFSKYEQRTRKSSYNVLHTVHSNRATVITP